MNAREYCNEINDTLTSIKEGIEAWIEKQEPSLPAAEQQAIRHWAEAHNFREAVENLICGSNRDNAVKALAAFASYQAAAQAWPAQAALSNVGSAVQSALNGLVNTLQPIFQKLSSLLWNLISNLLSLTEWTVSGDLGVSILGLSGTAKIELTFK